MKRYLETFFRYWLIVLVPIVALPAVEGFNLRHVPHQVFASLNIYTETPMGNSDPTNSFMTPAQIEQATINQWLQSPSFCLSVAKSTPRYARLLASSPDPLSQASGDLSTNVQVTTKGDNLVTIGYTSADPQLAMQVVKSVLDRATVSSQSLKLKQASGSKSYYNYQLYLAQAQERDSARKLTAYMQEHGITSDNLVAQLASDPTLAGLYDQNKNDHDNVTSLRGKIQALSAQTSVPTTVVDQSGYILADPPQYYTVSSRKKLLMGVGVALALGLLLSITFMVLLTALDRSLRQPEEVPIMLELPVLAIIPYSHVFARRRIGTAGTEDKVAPVADAKGARAS